MVMIMNNCILNFLILNGNYQIKLPMIKYNSYKRMQIKKNYFSAMENL